MNLKIDEIYDRASLLLVLVLFVLSIFLTSIFKYILFFFLPVIFLLKKVFTKQDFLKQVFFTRYPILSIVVYLITFLPIISSLIHYDDLYQDPFRSQWINQDNSWLVLYCYLLANYFLVVGEKYSSSYNFLARLALIFSFFVDFLYAFYKWFLTGFEIVRWQGSSGNPQLWGAQASLILVIWLMSNKEIDNFTRRKNLSFVFFAVLSFAIIASASVSNFIGLAFASLAWMGLPIFIAIALALIFLGFSYFSIYSFIEANDLNLETMRDDLGILAKKFLPRLRIWSRLEHSFPYKSFNSFLGMGFDNYKNLVSLITNSNNFHVHSVLFHNYFLSGVLGLVSHFALALMIFSKKVFSSKYFQAIILYILSSSAFECAAIYIELQVPFWLFMPLFVDLISKEKSSDGNS